MAEMDTEAILDGPRATWAALCKARDEYLEAFSAATGGGIDYSREHIQGGGMDAEDVLVSIAELSLVVDARHAAYAEACDECEQLICHMADDEEARQMLRLRYGAGERYSFRAIGEALNVSAATVMRRVRQAVRNAAAYE
jgi:DNA-directed RNA polymerase specialized sigma24 family protein